MLFNHCVMSDSFATPWIFSCQALLSMGFSRQEYWSGLPFPPPGDLPNPGIKPMSPALAGRFFTTELPPRKPILEVHMLLNSVFLLLIFLLLQSGFRQVPRRVGEISSPILGRNTCIISIHSLKNILHLQEKKKGTENSVTEINLGLLAQMHSKTSLLTRGCGERKYRI